MWQLALVAFTVPLQNVLLVEDVTCQFPFMTGHIKPWCSCGWPKMAKSHLLIISCQFYWLYLSLTIAPYNPTSAPLPHQYPSTRTDTHVHTHMSCSASLKIERVQRALRQPEAWAIRALWDLQFQCMYLSINASARKLNRTIHTDGHHSGYKGDRLVKLLNGPLRPWLLQFL